MSLLAEQVAYLHLYIALRINDMKICGIIAEYNPFHNGHEYHISKAKELTGCDFVVVCMSGNYVQRGLPAVINKYSRTKAALLGGADIVIELPSVYAVSSAENFAYGAVLILDKIGCDCICFGSECDDANSLIKTAAVYDEIEALYSDDISILQKKGFSYAKAMEKIISDKEYGNLSVLKSNDKLGIAYIRAMNRLESHMKIVTVKRMGGDYLNKDENVQSAMAVRNLLYDNGNEEALKKLVPEYLLSILTSDYKDKRVVAPDDFSDLLYIKLMNVRKMSESDEAFRHNLSEYVDVSDNIAGRIAYNLSSYTGFDDFAERIHSPEYTLSRIYRALIHILLDITDEDMKDYLNNKVCYARILGFNRNSTDVFSCIKGNSDIKLVSKIADAANILNEDEMKMLKQDIYAADLYDYVESFLQKRKRISEYQRFIVNCI